MTKDDFNILIVGVGGQGTILASQILAKTAGDNGYDVKVSEIHGMSQRGGSVTTQVRFGKKVFAPIISPGTVDAIIAFERLEALRALGWLKPGGSMIVNQQELLPMPVITGNTAYPEEIEERIRAGAGEAFFLDGLTLAKEAGHPRSINVVLLGKLSRGLPFPEESWLKAIEATVKPHSVETNLKAFQLGRQA